MEPEFEVKYVCTHSMLAEFYRKIGTGPRYPTVALVAAGMVGLYYYCVSKGTWPYVSSMFQFAAVLLVVLFFMPHIQAWMLLRSMKKNNDGVLPEDRVTLGETIEMDEGMVHLSVEYRKIKRVVRLKHSYMLMLGRRNGLILDPNAFTKGSFEEFKQFLREKRPDLKIPE